MTIASAPLPAPALLDPSAALFLDLDGTLLDFAATPDRVRMDVRLLASLEVVRDALGGALALVSGRPLAQIDQLCPLPALAAAGLHGSEIRYADGRTDALAVPRDALAPVHAHAMACAARLEGVLVEFKGTAIALHYRAAPAAAEAVATLAAEMQGMAGSCFERQDGNHVIELKPRGRDKGSALGLLMASPPFHARVPWMIGDDLTDEHAFVAAQAMSGESVIVGARRPTVARHALPDPSHVRAWLAASARHFSTGRRGSR